MTNILLVDDNEDLVETLSVFLKMKDYHVESALSHAEAKIALSTFVPDVMLLDVRINGEDGRRLCKEIKEKYNPDIQIILMSASPELLKDYEVCKADDVIEKPFNLITLIEKINSAVNKHKGTSPMAGVSPDTLGLAQASACAATKNKFACTYIRYISKK